MEQIIKITEFITDSFIHIWPYLVVTIPIAVFVKLSGASKYISKAMGKKPIISIILATVVGAFSPFCSCGVIPVIASLLIGGVPIAPIMSFWIASPSMDPEIFFLSTATIGLKLSIWRLSATFIISLLSGYITHILVGKGWLGDTILKKNFSIENKHQLRLLYNRMATGIISYFKKETVQKKVNLQLISGYTFPKGAGLNCCVPTEDLYLIQERKPDIQDKALCSSDTCQKTTPSFKKRLFTETWKASVSVGKFMTLAFLINACIQFYIPQESISHLLGDRGFFSIIIASFIGMPFYTSNITALPLISGLLNMGMSEGAALAFLISGPVTTLPAMAAVWGLVRRKIFFLYLSFALGGSIIFGILINLTSGFLFS